MPFHLSFFSIIFADKFIFYINCIFQETKGASMEKELDNIDKSIIRILQENARTPVKDIAKEVFLSSPAVSARIERLENEGF